MHRLVLVLGLAATGCSEFDIVGRSPSAQGPAPDVLVDPPSLTFGTLRTGETQALTFGVRNVGDATLHVRGVGIGAGTAFTVTDPHGPFELEPGQATEVAVAFSPTGPDDNYGQALVVSDDPDTPRAGVDLLGYGAVPKLVITPPTWSFGDTFVPCGASVDLSLANQGSDDLVVTDLDYVSGGMLSLDPTSVPELPFTIRPGESRGLTVDFAAVGAGHDTGHLDVTSNDPRGVVSADQDGEGAYAETYDQTFTEPGIPPVDVMILIDNSCSMEQDNRGDVRNGFPAFVAELQQTSDWHLVEVTRISGCANGGVLTPSTPNVEGILVDNAFNTNQHALTESLLELADVALGKTGPGQCNAGFLRPGALLHVIVMSDEPEQSGYTASYWVNHLGAYASSPDLLRISGVLDLHRTCGSGGNVYSQAVDMTGGSKLDICSPDWGSQFGDIASDVLDGVRTYNLAHEPDPTSVVVKVNGVATTQFTVHGNDVTIQDPPIGEGDVVEISYGTLATCE